jgi:hypothetical protein
MAALRLTSVVTAVRVDPLTERSRIRGRRGHGNGRIATAARSPMRVAPGQPPGALNLLPTLVSKRWGRSKPNPGCSKLSRRAPQRGLNASNDGRSRGTSTKRTCHMAAGYDRGGVDPSVTHPQRCRRVRVPRAVGQVDSTRLWAAIESTVPGRPVPCPL